MRVLGLDIGTTTVSAVIRDDGVVSASKTLKNDSFLLGGPSWERVQDPTQILQTAASAVQSLLTQFPGTERIGVTGQMHGIVYLDASGDPVSPLYTWQDGRGDLPRSGSESWAESLSRLTGYPLATGYGLVTHCYNLHNGLVPKDAAVFCTIHDYVAMKLAGLTRPVTEASDAASLGLFDVQNGCFDRAALDKAGVDPRLLPALADSPQLGVGSSRIPVYTAIGDNQASFLGATGGKAGCMLVNVGTGSQFSVHTDRYLTCEGLETRPFPGGGFLLVGASLCGGRAYALLERFFRQSAELVTGQPQPTCYDAMAQLLESAPLPEDIPQITPLFQGTRADPSLRGSITGVSTENFTPLHFIYGMMDGMADELHQMYVRCRAAGVGPATLIGSGNGLRRNPALCRRFEECFRQRLCLSENNEEAACGAAGFAASCAP